MRQRHDLTASDVSSRPIKLEPARTLYDARNLILRYNISRVLVVRDSKAVGIVTEKDIVRFMQKDMMARTLKEVRLDQVMNTDLITVDGESDLSTCAKRMLEKGISSVVVTHDSGRLQGIITKSDLAGAYANYYFGENLVDGYMTKRVFTVAPDETIDTVISVMLDNNVSRVVVVRNNKPVGIITGKDLLPVSTLIEPDTYSIRKTPTLLSNVSTALIAKDVMRNEPITITKDLDLADAAWIMVRNRISGLPVVNFEEELVGIVTRTDVVRALSKVSLDQNGISS